MKKEKSLCQLAEEHNSIPRYFVKEGLPGTAVKVDDFTIYPCDNARYLSV